MPFDPHDSETETIESLLAIARRMARRWSSTTADAEDVAQESILRLWSCQHPPRNVVTWLAVVTRRLCNRDRLRQELRDRVENDFVTVRTPADGIPPDLLLDIERIVDRLPDRDQRLVRYLIEGYQTRDIASALNCAPGDVGQMVARMRSRARRLRDGLRGQPSEMSVRATPHVGPAKIREGRCSHPTRDPCAQE